MKNKRIFIACYLAYTLLYVGRLNLSMAAPVLKSDGTLNAAQIGMLGSVFFVIYAVGRLLNGVLSERVSPRTLIVTGLGLSALANMLFSLFPPYAGLLLLWGINAYAQSMLWSAILQLLGEIYGGEKAKRLSAYMVTSVATGNIAGILFASLLMEQFGVQFAFLVPGALLLLSGVFVLWAAGRAGTPQKAHGGFFAALKKRSVCQTLVPAVLHGVIKDNISLWMAVFVADRYDVDVSSFSLYLLLIPTAGLVGRLLYPWLYRLLHDNETAVMRLGFLCCCVFSLGLLFAAPTALLAVLYLSVVYVSVSLVNTSLLTVFPLQFYDEGLSGTVSGIMDFGTYLGAGIGSAVYGVLIDAYGYTAMFLSFLIISVVSLIAVAVARSRGK